MYSWDILISLICQLQLWAELTWLLALDICRHTEISLRVISPILPSHCSKWKEKHTVKHINGFWTGSFHISICKILSNLLQAWRCYFFFSNRKSAAHIFLWISRYCFFRRLICIKIPGMIKQKLRELRLTSSPIFNLWLLNCCGLNRISWQGPKRDWGPALLYA